ncbi:MAG: hypothetical protein AAF985_01425 [Bacteroidota bacterium]
MQHKKMLNTTDQGQGKPLLHCASVYSWPGGDLYIAVKASGDTPTHYDITVTVTPSNATQSKGFSISTNSKKV